jgi:hypothetical protein
MHRVPYGSREMDRQLLRLFGDEPIDWVYEL